jgi:hypothetical protein
MVGPSLETWGLKPFGAISRYQTEFFLSQKFPTPLEVILHINTFPMVQINHVNQRSYVLVSEVTLGLQQE